MKQQSIAVLKQLKVAPMTTLHIQRMGIRNAPDVIYDIRKAYGEESIRTEPITVRTRWGRSRVARYHWEA